MPSSARRASSSTNRKASTSAVTLNSNPSSEEEDELLHGDEDDGDDDDDEQGEEYDVEALRDHRFVSKTGTYEFLVKWVGYGESENTWEPEDNISSPDLLAAYWNEKPRGTQKNKKQQYEQKHPRAPRAKGIRTKNKPDLGMLTGLPKQVPRMSTGMSKQTPRMSTGSPKTKTDMQSKGAIRDGKTSSDEADDRQVEDDLMEEEEDTRDSDDEDNEMDGIDEYDDEEEEDDELDAEVYLAKEAKWHAKYDAMDNWEEEVEAVSTLERASDGAYLVYLAFKSHKRNKNGPSLIYPLATANQKCPQKMLAFYERHLKFTHPTRDMSKVSPTGKSKRR